MNTLIICTLYQMMFKAIPPARRGKELFAIKGGTNA